MPHYAALYISDYSLLSPKLLNLIPLLRSFEGINTDNVATGMILRLDRQDITVNFMPDSEVPQHLEEFRGYVRSVESNYDVLGYVLHRIDCVQGVLGCVIEPGLDERVESFFFQLNSEMRSLLFMHDSVIDWDGIVLVGPLKGV